MELGHQFDRIINAIGVLILTIILVVGLLQVINRYISLPVNLYWTYEIARTFLALMTIVAIPYLFKNEADISFLPVLKRVTTRTDAFLLIRNVLVAALAVVLVVSSYIAYQTSGSTGLPMLQWFKVGWGYALLGVSSGLLFIVVLTDTRNRIHRIRGDSNV